MSSVSPNTDVLPIASTCTLPPPRPHTRRGRRNDPTNEGAPGSPHPNILPWVRCVRCSAHRLRTTMPALTCPRGPTHVCATSHALCLFHPLICLPSRPQVENINPQTIRRVAKEMRKLMTDAPEGALPPPPFPPSPPSPLLSPELCMACARFYGVRRSFPTNTPPSPPPFQRKQASRCTSTRTTLPTSRRPSLAPPVLRTRVVSFV